MEVARASRLSSGPFMSFLSSSITSRTRFCSGPMPRREFMRVGTLALGGMSLSRILQLQAQANSGKPPETSVILFWMWGGPSQLETYDMKPDAPSEFRGPLNPIRTNVPGMDICEYLPLQSRIADKFSLIRSLHHEMTAHNDGSIEVLTGKTPVVPDLTSQNYSEHPDFGMITSKMRGPHPQGFPQYVGTQRAPFMTRPTYLGVSHKSFDTGDPSVKNFAPKNLTVAAGMENGRLTSRKSLLQQFDRFRRDLEPALGEIDEFRSAAYHILTSPNVADAFDLNKESEETRDRYGRHRWGQSCLLARRLAEAGTAVINIDATAPNNTTKNFSWDDHAPAFHLDYAQRERLPQVDQALTALVEEVYERGLDQKVMVIACGEFGRTPKLTHAPKNFSDQIGLGRDHWPHAYTAFISGGGLRMGQVVGKTTSKSEYPIEDPLTPQDMLATVYRHLGIDYTQNLVDFTGRPIPILSSGKPIEALI